MPRLNVDEQKSLFEPIEITLEGKTYVITKVTSKMLSEVTKLAEPSGGKVDITAPIKQFAMLTGAKEKELEDMDLRKIGAALNFIVKEVTRQIQGTEEKNIPEVEEKK